MFSSCTRLRAAAFLFVASGAVSCGPAGGYPGRGVTPRNESTVTVTNHNWLDVKVYVVRGSSKFRLGTVTSLTTARLRLPGAIASGGSDFRLRVELIGSSESYTTEILLFDRGDHVDWVINSHLSMSHYSIR